MILDSLKCRDVFYNYGVIALNVSIPLFTLLYVVPVFGLEVYGNIASYQIIAVFLALVVDFGVSFALLSRLKLKNQIVQNRVSKSFGELRFLASIFLGFFVYFLTNVFAEHDAFNLALTVMGYSFLSAVSIELYWLQSKIAIYFLILLLGKLFAIFSMLFLSYSNYLALYSASVFFSGLFIWLSQYIFLSLNKAERLKPRSLLKYIKYIISFTILKVSSAIYSNTPRALNLSLLNKSELGIYMVWDQIYQLFNLVLIPINIKLMTEKLSSIKKERLARYFLTISVLVSTTLYLALLSFKPFIYEVLVYFLKISSTSLDTYANYFFAIISLGLANSILGMPACSQIFKGPESNYDYAFGIFVFFSIFFLLSEVFSADRLVVVAFLSTEIVIFITRFLRVARAKF